ncbi:hypothetical protein BO94DRAFT_568256 [Aspergillus sclerotioniger CBS 115572]|uniref:Xylanolytic transcriptional activator regulatory domain-containing protein n=1 Tax=Aspergillus sclerotioniger CBS 115572 TaxID=1450535 RepID=A0A317VZF6_9EURO|nr:hypothetical protein BO94DRAFT_568256 [Aspergillus sclerotioniger CBS 115572]PWY77280.1 hypothetical protein BO94DRAFT_568256 [Aspergillus sclerotioniger CBS 115572]
MTKSTGARLYRACLRCRQRKTKCDFRGGNYSRFRGRRRDSAHIQPPIGVQGSKGKPDFDPEPLRDRTLELGGDNIFHGGIQNPLEALQILAQTAANAEEAEKAPPRKTSRRSAALIKGRQDQCHSLKQSNPLIMTTEIIREGIIGIHHLTALLKYYTANYHPYFPIVPNNLLTTQNPEHSWATEAFLLASVLTIATQNRPDHQLLHTRLRRHIDKLILRVALGANNVRNVGSVEGILLLAEWMPHLIESSTYDEDCVAWNLIGLGVRQAYLLHLDKQSFPVEVESEPHGTTCRKRLAWIFTYLADRQISIQMGQAFWCRGPGLSTRFSTQDYPSLQPAMTGGFDYASFVQAQVELTTIFGNIHDILYASKSRTLQLMLMGDYSKYLDDGAKAMDMWKGLWSKVKVPSSLSCLLTLQFEYLQLYVNAFAFQAVIYRSYKTSSLPIEEQTGSFFPDSVMASPDGRHIYAAIDAAKFLLQRLVEGSIPHDHVEFLPIRYYLYEIYASVFLFKAHSVGALHQEECQTCAALTGQFISLLKAVGSVPTHIASRYAKLLERLWGRGKTTPQNNVLQTDVLPALDQLSSLPPAPYDSLQPPYASNNSATVTVPDPFPDILHMDLGQPTDLGNDNDTFFSSLPFFRGFQDDSYLMGLGS